MPRALISVSDKRGVVQFARGLRDLGWEIVCTGGTARELERAAIPITTVEALTGFPEILDGRVKTLHPTIYAAVLARHDLPGHQAELEAQGIEPIALVAVNLYPFRETVARADVTLADATEQIDIGGPAMLRAAAKNHAAVLPIVDPGDYGRVLEALRRAAVTDELRRELAAKVFHHTAAYDAAIARFLTPSDDPLPSVMTLVLDRVQTLRYGENPDQRAALYASGETRGFAELVQLHGKELSFNNLLDVEAASCALHAWPDRPACVIIKHTTPCGIALARGAEEAYRKALATDPKSAFGSVVGFNTVVDVAAARALRELFIEVVVAPRFHDEAVAVLREKKNLRVIELPLPDDAPAPDVKRVRGGLLMQDPFRFSFDESGWRVATGREPTAGEWRDLRFAWAAVASVKSNGILLARDEAAIGIGAGQMSRVDAVFLAIHKARASGHEPRGAVLASDAFFPFADSVEQAADAGISAIIQPGGSVRDDEVRATADRRGIAMVLTGRRQFRH